MKPSVVSITVPSLTNFRDLWAYDYVLDHLRDDDVFEFAAAGLTAADVKHMRNVLLASNAYYFSIGDEPVFFWGIVEHRGVGQLWGFGTPKTRRIIPAATRFGQRFWLPEAFAKKGLRRIEVRVPLKSHNSVSWLQRLGMTVECWDVRGHSVNGEQCVQLAYTTREYTRDYVHVQIEQRRHSGSGDSSPGEDIGGNSERYGERAA